MHPIRMPLALVLALASAAAPAAPVLVNALAIAGDATDLSGLPAGPNGNRLGGFASDLHYDRYSNTYYGIPDRGPGGGLLAYDTRVQRFTLNVDSATGAISNFQLQSTTMLTAGGQPLNGLNPALLNASSATLGLSQDPEGFAVGPHGTYFVSDEYGPAVREFSAGGELIRSFTTPANLIPRDSGGGVNYVDGRPVLVSGRQDNRGFEGLTLSPDGTKLYAMLQDPLVDEGSSSDGRRSRNLRLVEFDVATGLATKQMIYRLEDRDDINARIPGTADDFSATNQGRSIGISSITALNDHEFLVIERDNRGIGEADPTGTAPVGSKRVYRIDISGASDVSSTSLAGDNALPPGVVPVTKSLFLDVQAALLAAGLPIPEKLEGLTIGPLLDNGFIDLILGTDNDFSVTQSGSGEQFNVCTGPGGTFRDVALDQACPGATALLPTYLYAVRVELAGLNYVAPLTVAEPFGLTLFGLGLAGLAARRRCRA